MSFFKNFYGPYWIIDLWGEAGKPAEGYEVSVVYSCSSVLGFSSTDLWVLSRTPQLPKGLTLERIREIVEKQVGGTVATQAAGLWRLPFCFSLSLKWPAAGPHGSLAFSAARVSSGATST